MESIKTTEELLSEHKSWTYQRTDRNGTRYFSDCTCTRCGGKGVIPGFRFVEGGICFECGGSGMTHQPETIKVYTPEHAAKLAVQREARAKKAEAERVAKALVNRADNLRKQGFAQEDGDIVEWVIYRVIGNTYAIKDELKEAGCKFNAAVGWYRGTPVEGHECQRLTENDVLMPSVFIEWKDKEDIAPLLYENIHKEVDPSEWQGEIGERLDIVVTVYMVRGFDGYYGTSFMHLMKDENGNIYKWSTSKSLEENKIYHLRATVKDHAEYNGTKQTVVTRATVVKE